MQSAKRLSSDNGQQLQLLVALGARDSGVDEQRVRLSGVKQRLAGQFKCAEFGVDEVLRLFGAKADLVVTPHLPELLALVEEQVSDVRRAGVTTS